MTLSWPDKDPADVLDYSITFTRALPSGANLTGATWAVTPSGLAIGASAQSGQVATVFLSGGTAGVEYTVTCTATADGGRTIERSAQILVVNR
jgi:hypothetical protein